jgi:hypothetical protein
LQIKLTGMLEHNQSIATEDSRFFNTHELGAEMKLDIPRFLSPIIPDQFDLSFKPVTTIRVAYNHMQNVFFTRPTSGFAFGYTWFGNNFLTHYFNPIEVSYIRYYNESKRFIEFKDSRDYYKFSYEDYMIYSLNYSLVFYNRNPQVLKHYKYFRLFFESAGNGMYATQHFLSNSNSVDVPYETFNVVFAQYLKLELDYRFYYVMNRKTSVVSRVFGGVVAPYLNSEWVPNVKRYFVGGANSVRGWSARSLGPGSYIDSVSSFQYNLGDIKLEANIEARFPMFGFLYGAVFVDVGNVWSFENNELPGAAFSFESFARETAIATGYGFRFDFSFLLFRVDLGVKLREPYQVSSTGSHIIWGNRPMQADDFNVSVGIGYPF